MAGFGDMQRIDQTELFEHWQLQIGQPLQNMAASIGANVLWAHFGNIAHRAHAKTINDQNHKLIHDGSLPGRYRDYQTPPTVEGYPFEYRLSAPHRCVLQKPECENT
ncbi:hypothetical protein D3C73_1104010 [compost metagenome]